MATYIRFDSTDMVTSTDQVITSTWSDNTNLLEQTLYTSSLQYIVASASSQGQFYLDVYNLNSRKGTNIEVGASKRVKFKQVEWADDTTVLLYWNDGSVNRIGVFHLNYVDGNVEVKREFNLPINGTVLNHLPREENAIFLLRALMAVVIKIFIK